MNSAKRERFLDLLAHMCGRVRARARVWVCARVHYIVRLSEVLKSGSAVCDGRVVLRKVLQL
jgi:hypothetical protein